jgi:hypothetical protein
VEIESTEEATKRAMARLTATIEAARTDVNAFIEFIGEGPGGKKLRQAECHRRWQEQFQKPRSVTLAPVGVGKTTQLRHALLHAVGCDENTQIAYISGTERHPKKVLHAWQSEIERNRRVKVVFPHLRPGPRWSSTEAEVVRSSRDPDPTFQIFGAYSGSVLGSRAQIIVFDDLCNFENTLTPYARDKMAEWVGSVLSRAIPTARVICIGHIWADDDQLQRFAKKEGWSYTRDEATLVDPITGEELLDENDQPIPLAPDVLPNEEIRKKEADLGEVQSLMMLRNRVPNRSLGRFKEAMFAKCLRRGRGVGFLSKMRGVPCFTGVDLGHRKKPGSDLTVLFTSAYYPNGDKRVVDVRSGKWSGPEILQQIRLVQNAYASHVSCENNAAQQFLLDFAAEMDVDPIRPHTTTRNKWDLVNGIEGIAMDLDQERWILPCSENDVPPEELAMAIKAAKLYDPSRLTDDHTGDHLIAWWICREAMRVSAVGSLFSSGGGGGGVALPPMHDALNQR